MVATFNYNIRYYVSACVTLKLSKPNMKERKIMLGPLYNLSQVKHFTIMIRFCCPLHPLPQQRTASCVLFKSPLSTAAATAAPSTARAHASSEPPSKYPSENSLQGRSGPFARANAPVVGTSADGRSLSLRTNTKLNSTPTPNQHTAIPPHNMPYCLKVSSALQVDTAYMPAPPPLRLRPSPRRL